MKQYETTRVAIQHCSVISKGLEAQESKIASLSARITSLEEEVGRLSRGKKRKAIPNPNKKFMTLAEALIAGDTISEPNQATAEADVSSSGDLHLLLEETCQDRDVGMRPKLGKDHDHHELVHDERERPQLASGSSLLPMRSTD